MATMKAPTVLPEPWCSMSEEQVGQLKEEEVRQMFGAITAPTLAAFRTQIRSMRTSEIIGLIVSSNVLAQKLLADDDLDTFNAQDEQLIMAAALLALGDEIDRRIPRP